MSVLRIISQAPVIRDHYGRLWNQSQHPIGYMLLLFAVPLIVGIALSQLLVISMRAVQFLGLIFGIIFGFTFRTLFQIPRPDEADSKRGKEALEQLRQSSMYAVFVSLIALILSAMIGGGYLVAQQNPSLVADIEAAISADAISLVLTMSSIALLSVSLHYILTVFIVSRWLYHAFKTSLM